MRKIRLGVLLALVATTALSGAPVESNRMLEHIRFLSSDDLQGRGNGAEGLDRAADYIAAQFRDAGLEPAGTEGSWFQPFELVAGLEIGDGNELTLAGGGQSVRLTLGTAYFPMAVTPVDDPATPSAATR